VIWERIYHPEYMPLRFYMRVTDKFSSYVPTPAVWPNGGTPSAAGGPCLSEASWPALLSWCPSVPIEARRGVNGFGSFCRNKRSSPAGAKPGNTERHWGTRAEDRHRRRSTAIICRWGFFLVVCKCPC